MSTLRELGYKQMRLGSVAYADIDVKGDIHFGTATLHKTTDKGVASHLITKIEVEKMIESEVLFSTESTSPFVSAVNDVILQDYNINPALQSKVKDVISKVVKVYLKEVALALKHLHEQGIVHQDVKPLNILRHDDRMVLTDMDAASKIGEKAGEKFSSGYIII
jgi:serine/threonine protein kinase